MYIHLSLSISLSLYLSLYIYVCIYIYICTCVSMRMRVLHASPPPRYVLRSTLSCPETPTRVISIGGSGCNFTNYNFRNAIMFKTLLNSPLWQYINATVTARRMSSREPDFKGQGSNRDSRTVAGVQSPQKHRMLGMADARLFCRHAARALSKRGVDKSDCC